MSNPLQYQNPQAANVTGVLDSEVIGSDSTSGSSVDVKREYVVPQESINYNDPLARLCQLQEMTLVELRKIRILLEVDVPPGLPEDVLDNASDSEGVEDQECEGSGIEDD